MLATLPTPRDRSRRFRKPGDFDRLALATLAALAIVAAALALAGCGAGDKDEGQEYTVRGQVRQLPNTSAGASGLLLAHEAIDDFVDREGKAVGMDPMVMSFPVAEEVSLAGIEVNDVVEVDLKVDWTAEPAVEITGVEELPAGTKLVFRAAEPGRDGG